MCQLDEELGDVHSNIVDLEVAHMQYLRHDILQSDNTFDHVSGLIAELDCLVSFAEFAIEHNYVRPTISDENVIQITQGRHPLMELCQDMFVPNDTDLKETQNSMLITGANTSGKSIYITQVALIVFMSHLGSFIPASNATIGTKL
jgi:DNA mismatch repair protein MSH5